MLYNDHMKNNKSNTVKIVARENIKSVLNTWTTEVLEENPTKKDYENTLSFVEDIIKNAQTGPDYLKLVVRFTWLIEESKFAAKLLNYIFKTVVHSRGISQDKIEDVLEFDHKLIVEELKDAAEELRELKAKAEK